MSNLSNIGFNFQTPEDFFSGLDKMIPMVKVIKCAKGEYLEYAETTGVAWYMQFNKRKKFIGFNPHFNGFSKRNICVTNEINKGFSVLDGTLHAWADPAEKGNPNSGQHPFVFDVPDLQQYMPLSFPLDCQIQLSAFPIEEIGVFDTDEDFYNSQTTKFKFGTKSFVPSGLFALQTTTETDDEQVPDGPRPTGMFSGVVKEMATLTNQFSGASFYWMLVETVGGDIDVVSDFDHVQNTPKVGSIIWGDFWLTGRLLNVPPVEHKKGFFNKLFSSN